MATLNSSGNSHAKSLISSGKVNKTASWSFSSGDGNAMLGAKGDDWTMFGNFHLGINPAGAAKTKDHYRYPFGKDGTVYRSALTAIRQRASQQGDTAIFDAAGRLLTQIDGAAKSAEPDFEIKAAPFEYKMVEGDGAVPGEFEGYGSVFNNKDHGGDVMAPGAFLKTLNDHSSGGTMPKMLLNHGSMGGAIFGGNDPMADLPIGKWTKMAEDSHGLQVNGRLINLDTERGKSIYGAMKENELSGLSIGYRVKDFTRGTKPEEPRRLIKAVDLLEVSPVTFPANEMARINAVKMSGETHDIRFLEKLLRNVGGLSKSEAKAVLAEGYNAIALRDVATMDDEVSAMKSLASAFRSYRKEIARWLPKT